MGFFCILWLFVPPFYLIYRNPLPAGLVLNLTFSINATFCLNFKSLYSKCIKITNHLFVICSYSKREEPIRFDQLEITCSSFIDFSLYSNNLTTFLYFSSDYGCTHWKVYIFFNWTWSCLQLWSPLIMLITQFSNV